MLVESKRNELPTLESFLNDFFGNKTINKSVSNNVNVSETDKSYNLELALPGFTKEDINIEIKDDSLIISSVVESKNEIKEENYIKQSFSKSSFERNFYLGDNIDLDNINAKMENGILYVSLGKLSLIEEQPKNKIINIQ